MRKKNGFMQCFLHKAVGMAQRKGFEPLYELPHNMISNHARSTAPPSLQQPIYYNAFDYKKQVFLPMFSFLF